MQLLIDTYKKTGTLHHVYALEGERHTVFARLAEFLKKHLHIEHRANPDFWYGEFETLGIEESRQLKDVQSRKAFADGARKIIVVSAMNITHEAQNSLLKILEEPTSNTHFFIITSTAEMLLPTLRSRVMVVRDTADVSANLSNNAGDTFAIEFLKSTKAERLAMISEIIESKDKSAAAIFLDSLERTLHKKFPSSKMTPALVNTFDKLLTFKNYLHDRSPSVKIILESLSLIIPVIE